MVADTRERKMITVSKIEQVIFLLYCVNVSFLSGHTTVSRIPRSDDWKHNRHCKVTLKQNISSTPCRDTKLVFLHLVQFTIPVRHALRILPTTINDSP